MKYKPPAVNNRSGINQPGMTMYLTDTMYHCPRITPIVASQYARVPWNNILTSSDASVPTKFTFNTPILVVPGKEYAFILSYDGNETFFPWLGAAGDKTVDTNQIFSGNYQNYVGNYYEYAQLDHDSNPMGAQTQTDFLSFWRPLVGTEFKFNVYVARYAMDGVPVVFSNLPVTTPITNGNLLQGYDQGTGEFLYYFPAQNYEQVSFDIDKSDVKTFVGAQRVFQNTVFYPGGWTNGSDHITVKTVKGSNIVVANTLLPNGAVFQWSNIFQGYAGDKFLTFFDDTLINIRYVASVLSNTEIQVAEPMTYTNAVSKFMISPSAVIDSFNQASPRGKKESFMFLTGSSANSTVRFVNNCIESVTVTNGGTGYSNNDVLYIAGFENVAGKVTGGYIAVGNVVTATGTGVIVNVSLSNTGCGFVNTSWIKAVMSSAIVADPTTISNTTANTSGGSGAVLTYNIGATIRTELTTNTFRDCEILNLDLDDIVAYGTFDSPTGTTYGMSIFCQYYVVDDPSTFSEYAYYVNAVPSNYDINLLQSKRFTEGNVPVLMSYSNEFGVKYFNGTTNDKINALTHWTNNFVITVRSKSDSDFTCVTAVTSPTAEIGKYIINDNETDENTNRGAGLAKHLTTLINFNRLAEDLRLFITAYRPINSDIAVYAKIKNSGDPQAFDDEDWSRLQYINNTDNNYSSMTDEHDYVDLAYGFQSQPNTAYTMTGTVTTTNAYANVAGEGTNFVANSTFGVGTLVKIYDPLFPNQNFYIASVTAIPSTTLVTLDTAINTDLNTDLVGNGLRMDVMGYPHQAFNNILNENVARYYNNSVVEFDNYDSLQLKFVFLSSQLVHIPRLHNIRATGVSA